MPLSPRLHTMMNRAVSLCTKCICLASCLNDHAYSLVPPVYAMLRKNSTHLTYLERNRWPRARDDVPSNSTRTDCRLQQYQLVIFCIPASTKGPAQSKCDNGDILQRDILGILRYHQIGWQSVLPCMSRPTLYALGSVASIGIGCCIPSRFYLVLFTKWIKSTIVRSHASPRIFGFVRSRLDEYPYLDTPGCRPCRGWCSDIVMPRTLAGGCANLDLEIGTR
ncbi:hypothetical protein F5Y17DRAFT_449114 [Xylariaceae sp. FL0594]|nr:hypothetical protein F5Y17DRAFT_449114 [Xylariaceae sp. FL0594]